MIKINLIPQKKKTHIPFDVIIAVGMILVCLGAVAGGWVVFAPQLESMFKIPELESKEKDIEGKIRAKEGKVRERDDKKKQKNRIKNEITRLQRLSGANYVQWSTTLNEVKNIVLNTQNKVWITNLRIDSDRRVQISAYSCSNDKDKNGQKPNNPQGAASQGKITEGIQQFIQGKPEMFEGKKSYVGGLLHNQYFSDVFLTGATQNIYEKKPVWRFEINCRLLRELSKSGD